MAITNTSKSKEFIAGSSPIILKGDLRPTKMASAPDPRAELNQMALNMFGKELRLLTEDEMELLKDEYEISKGRVEEADGGRAQYGLGSLVKSVKKAVKGVVKGVKKNPLLAAAALNFAPMLIPGGKPFFGLGGLKGSVRTFFDGSSPFSFLNLSKDKKGPGAAMDALKIAGLGGTVVGLIDSLTRQEGETDQDFMNRTAEVKDQLKIQFARLYPQEGNESEEDYNIRIDAMVANAQGEQGSFSEGGRVNRAMGSDEKVEMAAGIEGLPININSKGVKEVDLRETGGFIPPVGVKEKADDIPAMLSNNEFVFTADAVRAAGGGSVNKGAQRMYDLMKNLESKVV